MHYLLFYEKGSDYKAKQQPHQAEHREHVYASIERGEILLAGSLDDPDDGSAVLVFRCDDQELVKSFVETDPFVVHGVVTRWYVRRWNVLPPRNTTR
jgi:uncharacterized protein YciI